MPQLQISQTRLDDSPARRSNMTIALDPFSVQGDGGISAGHDAGCRVALRVDSVNRLFRLAIGVADQDVVVSKLVLVSDFYETLVRDRPTDDPGQEMKGSGLLRFPRPCQQDVGRLYTKVE